MVLGIFGPAGGWKVLSCAFVIFGYEDGNEQGFGLREAKAGGS